MGIIREANNAMLPSVIFGFGDLPQNADILLDDINGKLLIRRKEPYPVGTVVDIYSYDEYDSLSAACVRWRRYAENLK